MSTTRSFKDTDSFGSTLFFFSIEQKVYFQHPKMVQYFDMKKASSLIFFFKKIQLTIIIANIYKVFTICYTHILVI